MVYSRDAECIVKQPTHEEQNASLYKFYGRYINLALNQH
jgi:hypothetical protein